MKSQILITKASGDQVVFDPGKLRRSLRRAGAGRERSDAIVRAISKDLQEGSTTKQIYHLAHKMLRKEAKFTAARYSLKQALLELGPSGFPFEQFVAKLLEAQGLRVQTGLLREGKCVTHEVDILAADNQRVLLAECKFHNRQSLVCDVKVPLYIHSRFNDLLAGYFNAPEWKSFTLESWIFTNTRFTDDALAYGRCAGLHLISWDTPFDFGLRDWVDRTGLHPLTCLTTLTHREKNALLEHQIVLARDLVAQPELLSRLQLAPRRIQIVIEEARHLCFQTA